MLLHCVRSWSPPQSPRVAQPLIAYALASPPTSRRLQHAFPFCVSSNVHPCVVCPWAWTECGRRVPSPNSQTLWSMLKALQTALIPEIIYNCSYERTYAYKYGQEQWCQLQRCVGGNAFVVCPRVRCACNEICCTFCRISYHPSPTSAAAARHPQCRHSRRSCATGQRAP